MLIGDAAGYNDPIIGEGLSIAMRDARSVRDLILDGARTPEAFQPYGDERNARMPCLRLVADIVAAVHVEDGGDRTARRAWLAERTSARDPQLAQLFAAAFIGPEHAPAEVVGERILDHIRQA